jgi:hypothetical protein
MQTVIQTSRRVDLFLLEANQNFKLFIKYSRPKIKNKKPMAIDVLFKAYSKVPLSCRSILARRYL